MVKKIFFHLVIQLALCTLALVGWHFYQADQRERQETYEAQLTAYREGLAQWNRQNPVASVAAFERVGEPLMAAREYFFYHKAAAYRAVSSLPQRSLAEKRRDLLQALSALEKARGLRPGRELARLIETQIPQIRHQLATNLSAAADAPRTLALLGEMARGEAAEPALVSRTLATQLKAGEEQSARQTAAQYGSLWQKQAVLATLTAAEQAFVKPYAGIRKAKTDNEKSITAPFAAALRSPRTTLHSGDEILAYLTAAPLIDEKQQQRFAGALADAYLIARKSEVASERAFVTALETKTNKMPVAIQRELVQRLWREGLFEPAARINQHLIAVHGDDEAAAALVFDGARLWQDMGNHQKAREMLLRYLEKGRGSDRYEEALFQSAWSNYMLGDPRGVALFARYREEFPHGAHETGALFFQIKLLEKTRGDSARIADLQHALLGQYPLSFYAIVIRSALHTPSPVPEELFNATPEEIEKTRGEAKLSGISLADQAHLRKFSELTRVGAAAFGEWELGEIAYQPDAPAFMYALAYSVQSPQNIHIRLNLLTRLVQQDDAFHRAVMLKDLFPNLYQQEIKEALKASHLTHTPPFLISSLIRQESAFHLTAQSAKKASGLMQLLETTAQANARAAGIDTDQFDLFAPNDNIRLGVATMAGLLSKYDGRLHYALAGYNAGEEALNRWIKARGTLTPLDFIESIPYKETRIYVLTILRNVLIYSYLYDHQPPDKVMSTLLGVF